MLAPLSAGTQCLHATDSLELSTPHLSPGLIAQGQVLLGQQEKNHLTDQDPLVCVASSLPPGHRPAQEARPSSLPFEQGDLQVTARLTA